MHPSHIARSNPDQPAVVMVGSGETLSYRDLDERSNRGAHLLRSLGLKPGDGITMMLENSPVVFEIFWAAQRAGLYITPIGTRLTADEVGYIVDDSGSGAFILSATLGDVARDLAERRAALMPRLGAFYGLNGALPGATDWRAAIAGFPATPIADERAGTYMLYSSGTTGRPKGVRLPLADVAHDAPNALTALVESRYGDLRDTVYLSPAPLYHAAPLGYCTVMHRVGATAIVMEKFDPEGLLAAIEKHRVTMVQMVPTMFVRLLKLPVEVRTRYDLSSLQVVIHAAAPCPIEVKRQMIDWWGPIIYEFYGGTEGNGTTHVTAQEWLAHPGTVGRSAAAPLHICAEDGSELPLGTPGLVYFGGEATFRYHNDEAKTASTRHPVHPGWSTLGDIGYLDEEGYLYLTDRKAFMIISGGVNIYPQEAENVLIGHPKVYDVAVIGVPDDEMGEAVKAVVQPADWGDVGPDLERELLAYCRSKLSHMKCPRSIDFDPELPRHDTGKLYKRFIRDRYWEGREARIA